MSGLQQPEDGNVVTMSRSQQRERLQQREDGNIVTFVSATIKHDFRVARRTLDPERQRVGLDGDFWLADAVPTVKIGRAVYTFVKEAKRQQRVTSQVTLRRDGGPQRSQLIGFIHDILPAEEEFDEESDPEDIFVARVVHLGLERLCKKKVGIEQLRLTENDLSDMRAALASYRRDESGEDPNQLAQATAVGAQTRATRGSLTNAVEGSASPALAATAPAASTRSRTAVPGPPSSRGGVRSNAQASAPREGVQTRSNGSHRATPAPGRRLSVSPPPATNEPPLGGAPLPRDHPGVVPRVRGDAGETAERHLAGEYTTPAAAAERADSLEAALAATGGNTGNGHGSEVEQLTRDAQADRLTEAVHSLTRGPGTPGVAPTAGGSTETLAGPSQGGGQDALQVTDALPPQAPDAFVAPRTQAPVVAPFGTTTGDSFAPPTLGYQYGPEVVEPVAAPPVNPHRASRTSSPEPEPIAEARVMIGAFNEFRRQDEPVPTFIRRAEVRVATYDEMKRQRSIGARAPISAVSAGGGDGGGGGHAFATPQGSVDPAMQDGGSLGQYTPAPNGVQIAAMPWPAASLLPSPPPAGPVTEHYDSGNSNQGRPPPPGPGRQNPFYHQTHHVPGQTQPFPSAHPPPTPAPQHPNRTATRFSEGVEEILNTLAERVIQRHPTVGYMRTTIQSYQDLRRLAPGRGEVVHILAVANISNGSAKTFERNTKLLGAMDAVLNHADFFITARSIEAGLASDGPADASAAAHGGASAAAQANESSDGT